jgi:hypothetical protein
VQDTVMALQAISQYAAIFSGSSSSTARTVTVTVFDPQPNDTHTITIDSNNNKLLQIREVDPTSFP